VRATGNRDRTLVDEMLRHLGLLAQEVAAGRGHLVESTEARYATEHATELLAEAAEKASHEFKSANVAIPWSGLRKLRREVAHPYDTGASAVDVDQLWRFARDDAPRLARALRRAKFPEGPG
jgi:uncharacterized protein with HEPN domain